MWEDGYIERHATSFTEDDLKNLYTKDSTPEVLTLQLYAVCSTAFAARSAEPNKLTKGDVKICFDKDGNKFYELAYLRSKQQGKRSSREGKDGKLSVFITGEVEVKIVDRYLDAHPEMQSSTEKLWKYLKTDGRKKYAVATMGNIGLNALKEFGKRIAVLLQLPEPNLYTGQCWRGTSCTIMANRGWF